jgi:hypothetical protein
MTPPVRAGAVHIVLPSRTVVLAARTVVLFRSAGVTSKQTKIYQDTPRGASPLTLKRKHLFRLPNLFQDVECDSLKLFLGLSEFFL